MPELDVKEKDLREEAMRLTALIYSPEVSLFPDVKERLDIEKLYLTLLNLFKETVPYVPYEKASTNKNTGRKRVS